MTTPINYTQTAQQWNRAVQHSSDESTTMSLTALFRCGVKSNDVFARRYVVTGTNHDAASNIEMTDSLRQSFDSGQFCQFGHLVCIWRSRIFFFCVTFSVWRVHIAQTNIFEGNLFRFYRKCCHGIIAETNTSVCWAIYQVIHCTAITFKQYCNRYFIMYARWQIYNMNLASWHVNVIIAQYVLTLSELTTTILYTRLHKLSFTSGFFH